MSIIHFIKYLYLKLKWHNKLSFAYSSCISINSKFEGMSKIHSKVRFEGKLGYGSYIGNNCCISADIGRFTSIAPYTRCNNGIHPYTYPYVSTAPCFFSLNKNRSQNGSTFASKQKFDEKTYYNILNKTVLKIGSDCWIGEGVFFVGGIEVGDGAIVLAHAVVTKNIPPYSIVGGVPAKILKFRYSKEDIDFLLKVKWWNNKPEWFKINWELLNDLEKLKEYYNYKDE